MLNFSVDISRVITHNRASSNLHAPVAQLDRVPGYEPGGRPFESVRARHFSSVVTNCNGRQ